MGKRSASAPVADGRARAGAGRALHPIPFHLCGGDEHPPGDPDAARPDPLRRVEELPGRVAGRERPPGRRQRRGLLGGRRYRGDHFGPLGGPAAPDRGRQYGWAHALLLHGDFGAFNGLLLQLGIVHSYIPWLSSRQLALGAVIVAHVWREFPLPAILFLAGLQVIPPDVVDAATVDGAGAWQRFRYVILPLLKAPMLIVLVYETMIAVTVFDLVYVLTGGGPGSATTLFSWYAYAATFHFLNLGQGAALSFIMAAVLLLFIAIYLRLLRVGRDDT